MHTIHHHAVHTIHHTIHHARQNDYLLIALYYSFPLPPTSKEGVHDPILDAKFAMEVFVKYRYVHEVREEEKLTN
jgi:hypothetical protein